MNYDKNHEKQLVLCRLSLAPHRTRKKPVKTRCNGLQIMVSRVFHGFSLAAFEAGGEPTAAAGIKGEREPIRLTGSALAQRRAFGLQTMQAVFMVFVKAYKSYI